LLRIARFRPRKSSPRSSKTGRAVQVHRKLTTHFS
jgi:hypothetical protein